MASPPPATGLSAVSNSARWIVESNDRASAPNRIDSVSTPDSLTAVFWFNRRYPQQFYDATYHMLIVPEHSLRAEPRDKLRSAAFSRAPRLAAPAPGGEAAAVPGNGPVTIWADPGTNALVINAPERVRQDMLAVIKQIDFGRAVELRIDDDVLLPVEAGLCPLEHHSMTDRRQRLCREDRPGY